MGEKCLVCHHRELADHEMQTCNICLSRTRRDLITIERLYALLPSEIGDRAGAAKPMDVTNVHGNDDPLPGGDALVLLSGGGVSTTSAANGDRSHAVDNLASDVPSTLAILTAWEDDFRHELDIPPATDNQPDHRYAAPPTVVECAGFLLRCLSDIAQTHPAFYEFATDIRELRGHLERVLREGEPNELAPIDCPECGDNLRREYHQPDPCPPGCPHKKGQHDQGGMRDYWKCRNRDCSRIIEPAEYWLLVRDEHERHRDLEAAS